MSILVVVRVTVLIAGHGQGRGSSDDEGLWWRGWETSTQALGEIRRLLRMFDEW